MYNVIRKQEAITRQIAETYSAANYITKDISPNISLAVTTANNHHETETTKYDRIYFVIEGEITLDFNGDKVILSTNDSCFISKDTTYEISGTFKTIIVNQPAFGK